MIIRTYQRRNRGNGLSEGSSQESFWSSSQESAWSSSQEALLSSSQDLSSWVPSLDIDLDEGIGKKSIEPTSKKRKQEDILDRKQSGSALESKKSLKKLNSLQKKVGLTINRRWGFSAPPNSTLMEAQESGEMMEHVDEVDFAMDGLREGQPLPVQQASLVSILSLCASIQQRRFLRSHGIAKTLLDAVVALPTTDLPLASAAASVLYLLASDGQDANLMDTDPCVEFLLKLIRTQPDGDSGDMGAKIIPVFDKLKNKTDITSPDQLTPQSLALRILEKACLSAVVLDDNSGSVTKVGGQFKERLRELGGLDLISKATASCLTNLMNCSNGIVPNVTMLLRCLKVMENVTFLSEENQGYLLRLKHHDPQHVQNTFIGIVIKIIDTLQEIMGQSDSNTKSTDVQKVESILPVLSNIEKGSKENEHEQHKTSTTSKVNRPYSNHKELKLRNALQKAKVLNSQRKVSLTSNCQQMVQVKVSHKSKRFKNPNELMTSTHQVDTAYDGFNGERDPYEFDGVDIDYKVQVRKTVQKKQAKRLEKSENSVDYSSGKEYSKASTASEDSARTSIQSEDFTLLGECILSAVKVLMNLTNDNATGCKQVAACNGIPSVASLLVTNYPRNPQTEASVDLLVTALGMLVNLVEKDENNRSQLANMDITLPSDILNGGAVRERSMIVLLCSLFMSKKGSGEAAEAKEVSIFEVDEEDSLKKGQSEAENMIVEAYTALLLAFLSTESEGARRAIAERLPAEGLQALVPVLERFVAFHLSLNMISSETYATVSEVINSLKQPS